MICYYYYNSKSSVYKWWLLCFIAFRSSLTLNKLIQIDTSLFLRILLFLLSCLNWCLTFRNETIVYSTWVWLQILQINFVFLVFLFDFVKRYNWASFLYSTFNSLINYNVILHCLLLAFSSLKSCFPNSMVLEPLNPRIPLHNSINHD